LRLRLRAIGLAVGVCGSQLLLGELELPIREDFLGILRLLGLGLYPE
jgi:hypothetical protein